MRADAALADRRHAVRSAAEGWRSAGAIDEATLRAIASRYADDRSRLGPGLRILAGLAALVGGGASAALLALFLDHVVNATLFAFALAVAFTVATEIQVGPLRRAQAGAEYATAILAATSAGAAWFSLFEHASTGVICAGFALAVAAAAWRWGYALFAGTAAVFGLISVSHGGLGHAACVLIGAAGFPLILVAARSPRHPPAHRNCFVATGLVLLAGAYLATNIYSLDHRWIDALRDDGHAAPGAWARGLAIAGTILMPPLVLVLGIRFRDRVMLAAGALFTAASLVTLRQYHPIGPWWLSLVLGGMACLGLAVALRRWLDAGPGRERFGFTAEAPFGERRIAQAAQLAATLAAMSPGPRPTGEPGFGGGGGRSGGGGATGQA